MGSEGFQLSQTMGGGEALPATIGSLTPVRREGGGGGVPICLRREREGERERQCVYICPLQSVC